MPKLLSKEEIEALLNGNGQVSASDLLDVFTSTSTQLAYAYTSGKTVSLTGTAWSDIVVSSVTAYKGLGDARWRKTSDGKIQYIGRAPRRAIFEVNSCWRHSSGTSAAQFGLSINGSAPASAWTFEDVTIDTTDSPLRGSLFDITVNEGDIYSPQVKDLLGTGDIILGTFWMRVYDLP